MENKKNNQFNVEGFAKLVDELATMDSPYKDQMKPLIDVFKDLTKLAKELEDIQKSPNPSSADVAHVMEELQKGHARIKDAFSSFCTSQGASVDEVLNMMNDPTKFSQQEWETAQAIERKVQEGIAPKKEATRLHQFNQRKI